MGSRLDVIALIWPGIVSYFFAAVYRYCLILLIAIGVPDGTMMKL